MTLNPISMDAKRENTPLAGNTSEDNVPQTNSKTSPA